jgi:hypothetical protein
MPGRRRAKGINHWEAHRVLNRAVAAGEVTRPDACELCGDSSSTRRDCNGGNYYPLNGHHEDYHRPLDVIWLCTACHRRLHGPGLAAYVTELRTQLVNAEQLLARQEARP